MVRVMRKHAKRAPISPHQPCWLCAHTSALSAVCRRASPCPAAAVAEQTVEVAMAKYIKAEMDKKYR